MKLDVQVDSFCHQKWCRKDDKVQKVLLLCIKMIPLEIGLLVFKTSHQQQTEKILLENRFSQGNQIQYGADRYVSSIHFSNGKEKFKESQTFMQNYDRGNQKNVFQHEIQSGYFRHYCLSVLTACDCHGSEEVQRSKSLSPNIRKTMVRS